MLIVLIQNVMFNNKILVGGVSWGHMRSCGIAVLGRSKSGMPDVERPNQLRGQAGPMPMRG